MNFTKIRYTSDDGVEMHWTEQKDGAVHTHELTSKDEPDVALPNALKAFVPLVIDACDLPESWEAEATVTGVSINTEPSKGGKPERDGIKVHFRYTPGSSKSPMLISTPHLRGRLTDETPGPGFIPDEWRNKIDALVQAAVKFIHGARSQQALPLMAGSAK